MTLNCNGKLIDLSSPKIMGILNHTPDSFFDGGKYKTEKEILLRAEKMLLEGADFIDVGAYSSRPNAAFVTEEQEIERLVFVLELLVKHFPEIPVSIDTFRSEAARISLENGAAIINDISAFSLDEKMLDVVAHYKVPYIMMHMRGTPQTMQQFTDYENLTKDIFYYFSEKIALAKAKGVNDLIVDVGFGFSKTLEQNYELLHNLGFFQQLGLPLLVGVSRKSMIYKALDITPSEALNGTIVIHTIALQKGANILRVHDVKEAKEVVDLRLMINDF
ncbi:MAG: dihydropteroate synthase [Flavobacteriaceae bacterium]